MSIFEVKYQISSDTAKSFSIRHARAFGGPGSEPRRSSETLIEEGQRIFQEAVEDVIFAYADSEELVLAEDQASAEGPVKDIEDDDFKNKIVNVLSEHMVTAVVAYLASRGPFNTRRFWLLSTDAKIKIGDGENNKKSLYVGFPKLVSQGNHGSVISAFADCIGSYLEAGGPSSIVQFCEASGKKIKSSKLKFAFRKGMHVSGFPAGEHKNLISDLAIIFSAMNGAKGKAEIGDLKFLDKDLVI